LRAQSEDVAPDQVRTSVGRPVAAVAALRETSVLFAALMGAVWLKEGLGPMRLAGAASVVAGVAALKL